MDDKKTIHITIRKGRSLPQLERCATCCTDFHCPFCSSVLFHPMRLSKVRLHLENHFNRAVLQEGYTIHRCGLDCRARMHYHCIYCHSMLSRKRDFMKHLSLCKEIHPALTFTFRALKTSTIQTSTTSTSPAPKTCTIPTSTTSTSPAMRTSITAAPASPKIKSATILHVPTTPSGQTQRFCVIPIQQKNCCIYKVGGGSIYHVMPSVRHAAVHENHRIPQSAQFPPKHSYPGQSAQQRLWCLYHHLPARQPRTVPTTNSHKETIQETSTQPYRRGGRPFRMQFVWWFMIQRIQHDTQDCRRLAAVSGRGNQDY